ncbi:cell wall-binding protein [Bacillus pseudomycoides]|nr:cell wall-binding protein [Bacillus pseudomycoides]
MHHTKDDGNFTKSIKVLYPNGKSGIHNLSSGQQLQITEAGTIVDLEPYAKSAAEHNLLYITQAQLEEGRTGVALNQEITLYVEKTSGQNSILVNEFYKKKFGANSLDGFKGLGVDRFSYLTEEQKKLATLTSKPTNRETLSNYVTNNPEALADFNKRSSNILADTAQILETPITSVYSILNDGNPYQIIPYKKGTNKVIVKKGSKYLSGKEENALQYSDVIGDDEVLELVMIDNKSHDNKVQFHLVNKNGVPLIAGLSSQLFHSPDSGNDDLSFTAKTNNEVHNWLREWYPGKGNEKQKYEGIEFEYKDGENFPTAAKDSSGNVLKNTWIDQGADYYYAGSDGVFLKGWKEIDGKTYYFHPDTRQVLSTSGSNGNHEIDGKQYHFDNKGVLQRSAWRDQSYSDASGAFIKEGLREIEGKIYYFQNYLANTNEIRLEDQNVILHFSDKGVLEKASDLNGKALDTITRVNLDGKRLVFERDGSIRKTGVSKIFLPGFDTEKQSAIVYYSLEEGDSYSGWKEIDGKKSRFKDGIHYTLDGHETIEGKRYYFNNDGQAMMTGFEKANGKIYHYGDKGVKQTGWQEIDGKWYRFDDSGAAKIGWFNGDYETHHGQYGYFRYYAKEDGSIHQNTTVQIDGKTWTFDDKGHRR